MRSYEYLQVTDEQRQCVHKLYETSENQLHQDVCQLREWAMNQPHLPEVPHDNMIEAFYLTAKRSMENTKELIDNYYTLRDVYPEFFRNTHPKNVHMQAVFNVAVCLPMPRLANNLHRVILLKLLNTNADHLNVNDFIGNMINVFEMRLAEDYNAGDIYICDLNGVNAGHLMKITPTFLMKIRHILAKTLKNRVQAIHILNPPQFIDILLSMLKTIIPTKIAQRVFTHIDLETLYEHIPKKLLPQDYDGELQTVNEMQETLRNKLIEYEKRFDVLATIRVDEELRSKKQENHDNFGYYGSFKKLEVD